MARSADRLQLTHAQRQRFRRLRTLKQLQALDPIEFELFCGYLYRRSGYRVSTTAAAGDEGVDLFLRRGVQRVVVQCKRYQGTVGQPTVRDLYGTMQHNGANAAVLVTTGRFSRAAEQWAADKAIQLVDGHDLLSWTRRLGRPRAGRIPQANYWRRLALRGALGALFLIAGAVFLWSWQRGVAANAPPAPTPPPVALTLPRLRVTLDGRLSEWRGVTGTPLQTVLATGPGWVAGADRAVWQSGWDDGALLGAVTIDDDAYLPAEESLTLYVALPGPDGALTTAAYTLRPGDPGVADSAGGLPVAGALLATARTNSGIAIEYSLPWSALGAAAPPPYLRAALTVRDVDDAALGYATVVGADPPPLADDPASWPWIGLEGASQP